MSVGMLTLAWEINERALAKFLSSLGGMCCGIVMIAILIVILIPLVTGTLVVGIKTALTKKTEQRKLGLIVLLGLAGAALMTVGVIIHLRASVENDAKGLSSEPPERRHAVDASQAASELSARLQLPFSVSSGRGASEGDWSLLRNGTSFVRYKVVTSVWRTPSRVEVKRTGSTPRTLRYDSTEDHVSWQDFATRLALEGCPPFTAIAYKDIHVEPETRISLESRSVVARTLTFEGLRDEKVHQSVKVCVSKEVAFPGIISIDVDGMRVAELVSSGNAGGVELGVRQDALPFNPFARADDRDWVTVAWKSNVATWTTLSQVTGSDKGEVIVNDQTRAESGEISSVERRVSTESPPSLELYAPGVSFDVASVTSGEVTHTIGEKTFNCVELRGAGLMGDTHVPVKVVLRASAAVRVTGLVSLRIESATGVLLEGEVVGTGTATGTTWGSKKPDW